MSIQQKIKFTFSLHSKPLQIMVCKETLPDSNVAGNVRLVPHTQKPQATCYNMQKWNFQVPDIF
jgi:hypothetical protein